MDPTQRRRPTIAKEWQLAILKKLQSESSNPTERQRSAAAAETGLDEKWVKNWFIRQRSKVAARNRKGQPATSEPRQPRVHSATVPTFKLQLCHPQGLPSRRSASTPIDSAPCLTANSCREPSLASYESRSPHPPRSTVDAQTIHCSHRSVSAPTYLNNPPQNPTLVPHTTTMPTYSRDPLCNRYPDFSQFFRPQVHERFCSSELSPPINSRDHLIQLSANPGTDSHARVHIQGLLNLLDPLHLGDLPTYQSCPVAFSMRLVDLLDHPRLTRYPIFLPSELGGCI